MSQSHPYFAHTPQTPPQSATVANRAILTPEFAVIPPEAMAPEVLSVLPEWERTSCWILVSPAIGHGTTFAQYLIDVEPGGGSDDPEPEAGVESFLFVLAGDAELTLNGAAHALRPGSFAFAPAGADWSLRVPAGARSAARCVWIRKAYEPYNGSAPAPIVAHERDVVPAPGPGTDRKSTARLLPPEDVAYDFHVNIVRFESGSIIATPEAHVMQHGLYMLSGKGVYLINERWHEVGPGHFIWMKAFCPQAFYAAGDEPISYLLYKDMNRQVRLTGPGGGAGTAHA